MKPIIPLLHTDYFAEIAQKISQTQAGDRVALISMSFDPAEPGMPPLIEALTGAAQRNVDVVLVMDAIAFMLRASDGLPTGPVFWHKPITETKNPDYQQKFATLQRLEAAGVHYSIINMPTTFVINPYAGRNHIKATIINDAAYTGGCNLSGDALVDMMLRFDDKAIADWLYDRIWAIAQAGTTQAVLRDIDETLPIDHATSLFLDSGMPGQSTIYQEALQLIDQANKHILMTCQYFPDAPVISRLQKAIERGVEVELYFNGVARQELLPRPGHWLLLQLAKLRKSPQLFRHELPKAHPYVHLKLIATEQAAIVGSHNYVQAGVGFGTAELAVLRHDATFSSQLIEKIRPHL
ncbi:MAG TPA: phospholipase D-like domain-containing protein [Candidatus Saccharimonadales bacterium]|nr:phospholipase D-like domain-containing protein [Candidatus Saccharimonadales bacterium]